MLKFLTSKNHIDDAFRNIIFEALEQNIDDFSHFCDYIFPKIREELKKYPLLLTKIKSFLSSIKEKHLIVIESGIFGTFPLLLASLDSRIEIKMYTSIMYLQKIYKERLFTFEYEKVRNFETLTIHDSLFVFYSLKNHLPYVKISSNKEVIQKAFYEYGLMILKN